MTLGLRIGSSRDVLVAARDMIADPAHWTCNAMARNVTGNAVQPSSPEAVCWCVEGAVLAARAVHGFQCGTWEALDDASREFGGSTIDINDGQGHEAALRLLDLAISIASSDAKGESDAER